MDTILKLDLQFKEKGIEKINEIKGCYCSEIEGERGYVETPECKDKGHTEDA